MFYSETLLSKTGPLARVWLSANLERKLSKTHILQSNIEKSVGAIVGQDQAPMALRLSGQLLLGVVRIYSRKARYLLEDCNEALMKIKMAFRPGNVDLPVGAISHTAAQLTLPDVITELDLLLPDPTLDLGDFGELPLEAGHLKRNADITLETDSFLSSLEQPRGYDREDDLQLEDDILYLDIGEEHEPPQPEIGREAPPEAAPFDESRMEFDLGQITPKVRESVPPGLGFEDDLNLGLDDLPAGFGDGMDIDIEEDITIQQREPSPVLEAPEQPVAEPVAEPVADPTAEPTVEPSKPALEIAPEEIPQSPLSSIRSSVERQLSAEIEEHRKAIAAAEEGPPSRKRKVLVDSITQIKSKVIKAQQADRSRILIEPSFLHRDPTVLALMSLTKTGGLAQSLFYPKNIAPELANLLSPDFVKRMAALKRKRDAGEELAEEIQPSTPKQLRLEIEEGEETQVEIQRPEVEEEVTREEIMEFPQDVTIEMGGDQWGARTPGRPEGSPSPQPEIVGQGEVSAAEMGLEEPFEITTEAPLQVVSRETRHAVHILREQFSDPDAKESVSFRELLPTKGTTRADATKMFFEVLVLATKDAVHVKQEEAFGDIEIKQKEALWGAWAEEKDEQQVAEEEELLKEQEKETGRTSHVVVGTGRAFGETTAA